MPAVVRQENQHNASGIECAICQEPCRVCADTSQCVFMYCEAGNFPKDEVPPENDEWLESCTRHGLEEALEAKFPDEDSPPDYPETAPTVVLACGHVLHAGCLKAFVESDAFNNQCPYCQRVIAVEGETGVSQERRHDIDNTYYDPDSNDRFEYPVGDVQSRQQASRDEEEFNPSDDDDEDDERRRRFEAFMERNRGTRFGAELEAQRAARANQTGGGVGMGMCMGLALTTLAMATFASFH